MTHILALILVFTSNVCMCVSLRTWLTSVSAALLDSCGVTSSRQWEEVISIGQWEVMECLCKHMSEKVVGMFCWKRGMCVECKRTYRSNRKLSSVMDQTQGLPPSFDSFLLQSCFSFLSLYNNNSTLISVYSLLHVCSLNLSMTPFLPPASSHLVCLPAWAALGEITGDPTARWKERHCEQRGTLLTVQCSGMERILVISPLFLWVIHGSRCKKLL